MIQSLQLEPLIVPQEAQPDESEREQDKTKGSPSESLETDTSSYEANRLPEADLVAEGARQDQAVYVEETFERKDEASLGEKDFLEVDNTSESVLEEGMGQNSESNHDTEISQISAEVISKEVAVQQEEGADDAIRSALADPEVALRESTEGQETVQDRDDAHDSAKEDTRNANSRLLDAVQEEVEVEANHAVRSALADPEVTVGESTEGQETVQDGDDTHDSVKEDTRDAEDSRLTDAPSSKDSSPDSTEEVGDAGSLEKSSSIIDGGASSEGIGDLQPGPESGPESTSSEECTGQWPRALASRGDALDTSKFLEICQFVADECVCVHGAVERVGIKDQSEAQTTPHGAHLALYSGRAPLAPGSNRAVGAIGTTNRTLLWSSVGEWSGEYEVLDSQVLDSQEQASEKERIFLMIRSDGNAILSRQILRLHRRDALWESGSGGDMHGRYQLEIKIDSNEHQHASFEIGELPESAGGDPTAVWSSQSGNQRAEDDSMIMPDDFILNGDGDDDDDDGFSVLREAGRNIGKFFKKAGRKFIKASV